MSRSSSRSSRRGGISAVGTARAMRSVRNARTDPRTSCFRESYLEPLGITSMLDVPIWANGTMIGVICHEHVGAARTWTAADERFAFIVGALVALAYEYQGARGPRSN